MVDWWDYPTNYSGGNSVTGVGTGFFKYPSMVLGNVYAAGFLIVIWVTAFVGAMILGTRKALMYSGFVTLVFSIYFMREGMINMVIVFGLLILTILGAVGSKHESSY